MFLVSGLDEVGRGALAGPLVAVASLFHSPRTLDLLPWRTERSPIPEVNDSKKLSAKKRTELLYRIIRSQHLIDFGIGQVSVAEIDRNGIDWANSMAFERAIKDLRWMPDFVIVDGDKPLYNWNMMDQRFEPRADGTYWPVGAASILAKVIRDSYMTELAKDYGLYDWDKNVGYGSEQHRSAIIYFGPTPHHRKKFISKLVGGFSERVPEDGQ